MFYTILGLILSASSAIMFTLAFPPYDLWPLIFVGMVPMIVSLHRIMPKKLSGLAMGIGIGGFFFGYFNGMFTLWFMKCIPMLIGIITTFIGFRERAFHERTHYHWFVPQGAIMWVGVEMIRGFIPVIGTWGFVSYALYKQPWLIQPVSIFGIYGLNLLIMFTNYALALGCIALIDRYRKLEVIPYAKLWLRGVAICLVLWTGLSLILLDNPVPNVKVAAIQLGRRIQSNDDLELLLDQTRKATADIIVWPESVIPLEPKEETIFPALAEETNVYLVIGYAVLTEKGLRNEATVVSPDGTFLGVFGKDHPVRFSGETSITRGTYPVYDTHFGTLGIIICYDLDFTDTARKIAKNGAKLIAVPSWDWEQVATKHFTHAVFRAVENRVTIVKADGKYDSAIIDPYGRIIEQYVSLEPEQATVEAYVPMGSGRTIAMKLGDWIGWLALLLMVVFAIKKE